MSYSFQIIFTTVAVVAVGLLVGGFILQLARVIERVNTPPPKAPQQPWWWPSFERQFAAYVERLQL